MKWKDIFFKTDQACDLEYRAIHDCIASAIKKTDEPDPDADLSIDDKENIKGMLDTFRDWADTLMKKCDKVVISVRGGVAEPMFRPPNVCVEIRDYDTDGCDLDELEEDGSIVSVYGEESE